MTDVAELVEALTESDLRAAATLDELEDGMRDRAPMFAQLGALDLGALDTGTRARLRDALEALASRDSEVRSRLEAERDGVREMLHAVGHARGVARAYRGASSTAGSVLRTA